MSNTPSRRLCLRRKRSNKASPSSGSPAPKKSSPSLDNFSGDEGEKQKLFVESQVYASRRTPSSHNHKYANSPALPSPRYSLRSPKGKGRGGNVTLDERSLVTPKHRPQQQQSVPEEILRQYSPDMPFLSSQLCSTQECEVIWDCDSPGFSKDDLKRMHGSGGDSGGDSGGICGVAPLVMVAPAPHRALFPRTRTKAQHNVTNQQLNLLLDQLSSNNENKQVKEEQANDLELPELSVPEPGEEESSGTQKSGSTNSPQLPRLLHTASSQPFTIKQNHHGNPSVKGEHKEYSSPSVKDEPADDDAFTNTMDDSVWNEELNLGICDISGINLTSDTNSKPLKTSESSSTSVSSKEKTISGLANLSSESTDVFDDDLFNESVIRTTQQVEEAMTENNKKKLGETAMDVEYQVEFETKIEFPWDTKYTESEVRYSPPKQDTGANKCDNNSIPGRGAVKLNDFTKNNTISSRMKVNDLIKNSCDVNKVTSSVEEDSCSPVLGRPRTSPPEKPPHRQVRNSFRLRSSSKSPKKSFPAVDVKTEKNIDQVQPFKNYHSVQAMRSSGNTAPVGLSNKRDLNIQSCVEKRSTDTTNLSTGPRKVPYRDSLRSNEAGVSSATGKLQTTTTGKSQTSMGGMLQTTSTGKSQMSTMRNYQLSSTGTGNLQTPNTGKLQMPSTSSLQTPSTRNFQTSNTGNLQTPNTGKLQVPRTRSLQTPSTRNFQTSNTGNLQTSSTGILPGPSTRKFQTSNTGPGKLPPSKGPLPRSQSTGDARVPSSSTTIRRSNSSAEADVLREFEEDEEIFKSLLTAIPDDNQLLLGIQTSMPSFNPIPDDKQLLLGMKTTMSTCKPPAAQGYKFTSHSTQSNNFSSQSTHQANKFSSHSTQANKFSSHSSQANKFPSHSTQANKFFSHSTHQPNKFPSHSTLHPENSNNCLMTSAVRSHFNPRAPLGNVTNGATRPRHQLANVESQKNTHRSINTRPQLSRPGPTEEIEKKIDPSMMRSKPPAPTTSPIPTCDVLDDDLFEDDVLSMIDEVESQFGSQPAVSEAPSSQPPLSPPPLKCTQDEIARKKETARRIREERKQQQQQQQQQRQRHASGQYRPVC